MIDRDQHPDSPPGADSDIKQVVEARKDAVEREGGEEPATLTAPGLPDGVGGTGGVTKNQGDAAQ